MPDIEVPVRAAWSWWWILAAWSVGIVAEYIAMGVLTDVTAPIRLAVAGVGLVVLFLATSETGRRVSGQEFETTIFLAKGWLVLVGLMAITAGIVPYAESRNPSLTFEEPVLAPPDLLSRHPLGTDTQGLDILGGIAYGLRVSMVVGLGTVILGIVIGGVIGTFAGYHRKAVEQGVELFTNALLAFPPLILLLGVAAVLDRNVVNITLALAVITIPVYIRLARATTKVVGQREFVVAARALGATDAHIIRKDIAPAVLRPLLSYAFVMVASIIVAEASLSYLGLGIPRPEPTLGNMISAGQTRFEEYPHVVFIPATALFLTVLALNLVGEELQRRWNPRQQKI